MPLGSRLAASARLWLVSSEALRDWQLKHELRQEGIKRLRQMWDVGVASGSANELDMKELRQDARARLESTKKAAGDADYSASRSYWIT
jgi:uncharacterized protein YoaH (UPF0181 family)